MCVLAPRPVHNVSTCCCCPILAGGDRFTKPLHHLDEVLEHYDASSNSPQYIVSALRERIGARRSGGAADEPPSKKQALSPGALKKVESKTGMASEE